MEESTVRDRLREYVSTNEPPMRLTTARVLASARRTRLVQRVGYAGLIAVMAILVAVGVPVVLRGTDRAAPVADGDPVVRRLTVALQDAMRQELPDATFTRYRDAAAGPLVFREDNQFYRAVATVTHASAAGSVQVAVAKQQFTEPLPTTCAEVPDGSPNGRYDDCETRTGDPGESVVIVTWKESSPRNYKEYLLWMTRPDGTRIILMAMSADDGPGMEPDTPAEPPLNRDQMVRVALHPGLTVGS